MIYEVYERFNIWVENEKQDKFYITRKRDRKTVIFSGSLKACREYIQSHF